MPSFGSTAPADTDLLCESCGYILNGLNASNTNGVCPECGEPLADSIEPGHRRPAAVESTRSGFWATTLQVLVRKRKFFRQTLSRPTSAGVDVRRVARFGQVHRAIAGVLFGAAAAVHLAWMAETRGWVYRWTGWEVAKLCGAGIVLAILGVLLVGAVTRVAIRLTTTESRFWGMRLPLPVVTRAMDFHAANYLPVAILAIVLTAGFRLALTLGWLTPLAGVPYLVALSVAVVVGAIWLFESFVIAMRRIRYANF